MPRIFFCWEALGEAVEGDLAYARSVLSEPMMDWLLVSPDWTL